MRSLLLIPFKRWGNYHLESWSFLSRSNPQLLNSECLYLAPLLGAVCNMRGTRNIAKNFEEIYPHWRKDTLEWLCERDECISIEPHENPPNVERQRECASQFMTPGLLHCPFASASLTHSHFNPAKVNLRRQHIHVLLPTTFGEYAPGWINVVN